MSTSHWPKDFLWGAATAAHQVEGNNVNNWSRFELERAAELAKSAPARYKDFAVWPEIKSLVTDPDNYVSGLSTDHYRRYREDFDSMQSLNFNAFRFSIEWSRCEPKEGKWDAEAFAHYRVYIRELKARGITPVMTLYHWTHPLWFDAKGGFARRKNTAYFVRFAKKVAKELGEDVPYVCTINEPDTVMMQGYVVGNHAPGHKQPLMAFRVYLHLLAAHKKVYTAWKQIHPTAQVGLTKQFAHVAPANDKFTSKLATRLDYFVRDDMVMRYIRRRSDFIGAQFYFTDRYDGFAFAGSDLPRSDLNWPMQPENLEPILKRLGKWRVPIIVTETGLADMHDSYRKHWIQQTIMSVRRTHEAGVPIVGYLYWSLLDNFEWAEGRWPRFGLIAVDYENGRKRTIRPSAQYYAKIIAEARGMSA